MSIFCYQLGRIESNDPGYTELLISPKQGVFPRDIEGWESLGRAIGQNPYLKKISIQEETDREPWDDLRDEITSEYWEAFGRGFTKNRSIEVLEIWSCNLHGGAVFQFLSDFIENNHNLQKLALIWSRLGPDEMRALCSVIERATKSLTNIILTGNESSDDLLADFVASLMGHDQLQELSIEPNKIGRRTCAALANLLQSPNKDLRSLSISGDTICDDDSVALASALTKNTNLTSLVIRCYGENEYITSSGLEAFSRLICDTSSIDATYNSNHTLEVISVSEQLKFPGNFDSPILLNRRSDKKSVAIQKVVNYHLSGHFEVEPFEDMDVAIFPLVLARICVPLKNDTRSEIIRISSLYHFLRTMPSLVINGCTGRTLSKEEKDGTAPERIVCCIL